MERRRVAVEIEDGGGGEEQAAVVGDGGEIGARVDIGGELYIDVARRQLEYGVDRHGRLQPRGGCGRRWVNHRGWRITEGVTERV